LLSQSMWLAEPPVRRRIKPRVEFIETIAGQDFRWSSKAFSARIETNH
jgi:hypothetical protein